MAQLLNEASEIILFYLKETTEFLLRETRYSVIPWQLGATMLSAQRIGRWWSRFRLAQYL